MTTAMTPSKPTTMELGQTANPSASQVEPANDSADQISIQPLEIVDEEPVYELSFQKHLSIVIVLTLTLILEGLDSTIIATAVPTMARQFGSIQDIGWYTSVFKLTMSSFQFLFGKMYTILPTKIVFLISLAIFGCGNLLCGLAPSSHVFILGRAVSGLATAGIISGAFALVTHNIPRQKRSIYNGAGSGVEGIAGVCAPLLGGVLTDRLSWRWCFYIQMPLTAITFVIVACLRGMPQPEPCSWKEKLSRLDLFGTAMFVPAITSLMLATQWGGSRYAWDNWRVILTFSFFVILLAMFVMLQRHRKEKATLPPRIAMQRSILFGALFTFCNNSALNIMEFYMPIYFQLAKHLTAAMSGVMVLPNIIGMIFAITLSGYTTSRLGYYTPSMLLTGILTPIATGLLTTLTVDTKTKLFIVYQALLGFGGGIGFQGPQAAVSAVLPHKDVTVGIAVIQFAQGIGPAVFIAAAQSLFLTRLARNIQQIEPSQSGLNSTITADSGPSQLSLQAGTTNDPRLAEAYDRALTQTFALPVALSCLSLVGALGIEWRSVKSKRS